MLLRLSKLWADDPERLWPLLKQVVVPGVVWLVPSFAYGAERVPASGGGVIAANHLSAIDPPLVGMLCPRTIYFMTKAELLAMPVVGELLACTGAFPVRRGEGDRDALRRARELVREGHMVGIFLEGTRQKLGYPGPIQPGGLAISMQEGAPLVPCGVYSFGWSRKNRQPAAIVWGEPMTFEGLPRSGRGYRRAAELLGGELIRLWRRAAQAVADGFPEQFADGTRRSGPHCSAVGTRLNDRLTGVR